MSEIVLIMGYNAAGKTTLVKEFEKDGYFRINRNMLGGKLDGLIQYVDKAFDKGHEDIVLDNTYRNRESRASIIQAAKERDIPIRCVWLDTSFEDAQLNACLRMVDRCGDILSPEEMKESKDPNIFPPAALYGYRKNFEPPTTKEGFSEVEKRSFERRWERKFKNKAIILDYDGTLRCSTGPQPWPEDPSHVEILPNRREVLQRYKDDGYHLLGVSNQSAIAKGLSEEVAVACFERTNELLGFEIDYRYCPHKIPPIRCYCRKPGPGFGAYFILKYKLVPSECIMVGDYTSDETFAKRCGFEFQWSRDFFNV